MTRPRVGINVRADRIVAILDRPEARNAIDLEMVGELHHLCNQLESEPRVLVLTGSAGVFAAGADISQLRDRRRGDALAGINSGLFERIARLPLPTIAAVDGVALGGGAELAYACDFRIASRAAKFGNPEPQLGIMAAAGATWRLRTLVGDTVAKAMLLAGRVLDADEALAAGLVSEVVASEALLDAAHGLADRILRADTLALRLTKLAFAAPVEAHPVFDNVAQAVLFESEEKLRRMTAFLDGRR